MYINLIDMMKQYKISQNQLADLLDVRAATISDKVNGNNKGFYFDEAVLIKKVFFPNLELEFLFANDKE